MSSHTIRSGSVLSAQSKTVITQADDELADQDEANPFSFKRFVKSKNLSAATDQVEKNQAYSKGPAHHLPIPEDSVPSTKRDLNLEFHEPFFCNPTIDDLLPSEGDGDDSDDDWNGSYQPSFVEQAHSKTRGTTPLARNNYDSFSITSADLSQVGAWQLNESSEDSSPLPAVSPGKAAYSSSLADVSYGLADYNSPLPDVYHGKADRDSFAHADLTAPLSMQSLQMKCDQYKEEHSQLQRKIGEMQKTNEAQTEKIQILERKLAEKKAEEEKEAKDLESMVQQVEQNLERMTKRAMKAENNVARLKQDMIYLKAELVNCRVENADLRHVENVSLNAARRNAQLALENLHKVVDNAQSSINRTAQEAFGEMIASQGSEMSPHSETFSSFQRGPSAFCPRSRRRLDKRQP